MSEGFCIRGLLLLLIFIDLFIFSTSSSSDDVHNLHAMLFNKSRYDANVLPKYPWTVDVDAIYTLQYVNSLEWNDTRLQWSTTDYRSIEYIFVPENKVWHPDLVVLNSIHELQNNIGDGRPIQIFNDGRLVWNPIVMLTTFCKMFIAFFPFDYQYCYINLASLNYPEKAVRLNLLNRSKDWFILHIDLEEISQGDWEIIETHNYRKTFWTRTDIKEMLKFGIHLKRLSGHYIMIVIFPTILTAALTFLTFFLPIKSGVRIGYILTVVLALVVLLTLFADTMPSTTMYPSILVALFTVTLGMAFLLVIITMFVMGLYNKPKRHIAPNWMHFIVRRTRMLKLKLKCRARRINPIEQQEAKEDGRSIKENENVEKSTPLKPYSNKELAEFFDYFLFIVFTVLYIASLPITVITCYTVATVNSLFSTQE
ncbi:CHRNA6 [Mytilus coruscus]|uniref:CHRNA6 n=1 Tax=Mytilus coruscus TaxID=42192 RepID=A0A6J8ADN2_MYTCO|nr:CHRNA6 [Mytilus coruscus]